MLAMGTVMPAATMYEEVQERASEKQEIGQHAECMRPVLRYQKEGANQ